MLDSPELSAAKADGDRLCNALGLPPGRHSHKTCAVCGGHQCLQVFCEKGQWGWTCYQCKAGGTVVDALMLVQNKSLPDAMKELCGPNGKNPRWHKPPPERTQTGKLEREHKERPVPVPDLARLQPFVEECHEYLLSHLGLVQMHERGISVEVIQRFKIGFAQHKEVRFAAWQRRPYVLNASWVLPVADEAGEIKGVKLHHEEKPIRPTGEPFEGKCSWAPFGTEPKFDRDTGDKPADSFYTLWPWPGMFDKEIELVSSDPSWWVNRIPPDSPVFDRWHTQLQWCRYEMAHELSKVDAELSNAEAWTAFERAFSILAKDIQKVVLKTDDKAKDVDENPLLNPDDWVFICPGELKALAFLSDGLSATASTGGESWIPPPRLLSWFRGRRVCLVFDDDQPRVTPKTGQVACPGREWARRMAVELDCAHAADVAVFTSGKEKREPVEQDAEL